MAEAVNACRFRLKPAKRELSKVTAHRFGEAACDFIARSCAGRDQFAGFAPRTIGASLTRWSSISAANSAEVYFGLDIGAGISD
jgi:hypothetical protein